MPQIQTSDQLSTTLDNVIAIDHGPPAGRILGEAAIAGMRRYLLDADLVGGYAPQFVQDESQSRLWTAFWFAIRRLDDLVDRHGYEIVERLEALADRLDATVVLRAFVDAAPIPQARRRVTEVLRTPEAEKVLLGRIGARDAAAVPAAGDLLELWYFKAYVPAYVGLRLWLPDSDDVAVRRLAMLAGAAMQWLDDLYDLGDDLAAGKTWLTCEELGLLEVRLGEPPALSPSDLERITRLREAICLAHFLAAEEASAELAPADRRRAVTYVEAGLRFCQPEQFRVYRCDEPKPWAHWQYLLDHLPGDETARYRWLHGLNDLFVALPLHGAEVRAARHRLETLGGCPAELAPELSLAVMEAVERQQSRRWDAGEAEEGLSPLERVVARDRTSDEPAAGAPAGGPPLPVRPRGAAGAAPRPLGEVVAGSFDLGRRVLEQGLRQCRRTAEELRDRSYGPESLVMDLRETTVRAVRTSLDLTALGFEALGALTRRRKTS